MTPLVGGTTLLLVGAMLIRLTVTDAYQRYVRTGMGPWLLLAGVVLAVLGAVAVVAALRAATEAGHEDHQRDEDHQEDDGHEHEHGDRIGWLLLVPVLALLLVVPPALGSFGVDRSRVTPGASDVFDPLPAGTEPREMTLLEFDQRAFDRGGHSMQARTIRLTGFVAKSFDGNGFRLARYQIACCAADAVAAVARVSGTTGAAPARDAWYIVTGTFHGVGTDGVPEFVASTVQQMPAPLDPYE